MMNRVSPTATGTRQTVGNSLRDWLVIVGLLLFAYGCTAAQFRLNPGECLVIMDGSDVVTVGKDCQTRRYSR